MVRKLLVAIALGMLVLVLANCGPEKGSEPDPKDVALEKLSATWKASQVTLDAVVQSGYENFTLTISGSKGATSFGYACGGRPTLSPWRSSGNWTFGNNFQMDITRDPDSSDALPVIYSMSNDGKQLELTFDYQLNGEAGRVMDVKGGWVFNLTRQ
jgi:hypothetical protein